MSDQFPYADIIILALIAGFVLLRLRAVLGQKIGQDAPPPMRGFGRPEEQTPIVQVALPRADGKEGAPDADAELVKALDSASAKAIADMKKLDAHFSLAQFLDGAHGAFGMVFEAFLKNDRDTLKMLLSPALYEVFAGELERRNTAETYRETTLVSIISQEAVNVSLEKNTARIRVRFMSDQITVERDRERKIIEGNPSQSELVQDEWAFERDMGSRNPNWKIIET